MELSSVTQTQPFKISRSRLSRVLGRHAADFSKLAHGFHQERRFIALAAVRDRSEIRGVGFDQDAVERGEARSLAKGFGFRKGEDPAEAEMEAEIERLAGFPG